MTLEALWLLSSQETIRSTKNLFHNHFQSLGRALMVNSRFPLPSTAFCFGAVFLSVMHWLIYVHVTCMGVAVYACNV